MARSPFPRFVVDDPGFSDFILLRLSRIEPEELSNRRHVGHGPVRLALFLEPRDGVVEDLVDDLRGQDLDVLPVLLAESFQPRARFFHFGPQDGLHLFSQRYDGGDDLEGVVPLGEFPDLLADNDFRLVRLFQAVAQVLVDDTLQVVDVEEVYVVDPAHLGVHVARHGNVDEKEQAVLPPPQGRMDHGRRDDVPRSTRGADDDVGLQEFFFQQVESRGDPLELFGDLHGAGVGAVNDDDLPHAVAQQVPCGKFGHLACTHQQGRLPFQASQNLLGHLHGGKAHRHGIVGNGRFGAHAFGRAKGVVNKLVENDPR